MGNHSSLAPVESSGEPRIGLVNLMPSPVFGKTEDEWRESFGATAEIVPLRFEDDPRLARCRSAEVLRPLPTLDEAVDGLDGLVITGANLEVDEEGNALPFESIIYARQLKHAISLAETLPVAVYSCLASHIALKQLVGVERQVGQEKVFGLFCHEVKQVALTEGLGAPLVAPHSRWGDIPSRALEAAGVEVLADGFEAGWLLAQRERAGGTSVFIQGHPEYGQHDLAEEYLRDQASGQLPPHNYFPYNDPSREPRYVWRDNAATLFQNLARIAQPSLVS